MSGPNSKIKLGQVVKTQKGYAFKSQWYIDEGTKIVKVSDFTFDSIDSSNLVCIPKEIADNYQKYKLGVDDVIVQTVGSWPSNPASVVGKVIRVPNRVEGALLNQNAVKLIPDERVDKKYLFYLLKSPDFKGYIINTAQGAASQASITLDSIRHFKFDLPDIDTQQKIASILSAFDDLIENNTRRIAILEEMARLIYREWFVHYSYPGHENDKMVDSGTEFGEVPEGWEVKKLLEVCELQTGKALKSKQFNEEGIGIKAVRIRNVRTNSSQTYTDEDFDDKYIVKDGDILVGMDGDFHMCRWTDGQSVLVQRVARFRPHNDINLSKYFFFWAIKKPIDFFDRTITGTTVAHLGKKHIETIEIVLPPKDMWGKINEILDPFYEQELVLRKKNKKLKATRDLLLPMLISGEIEIS